MMPDSEPTPATASAPAISALPPVDPLEAAKTEIVTLANQLRNAERRILSLDEERGKLKAAVEKIDANPLLTALRHLDAGAVLLDAGEQTSKLFAACREKQSKGKISLTLSVEPAEGRNRAMVYFAETKVTEPKEEPTTAFIFLTADGKLTRENWGERDLPMRPGAADDAEGED